MTLNNEATISSEVANVLFEELYEGDSLPRTKRKRIRPSSDRGLAHDAQLKALAITYLGHTMLDWINTSPEERLIAEQAILDLRELNKGCDTTPDGKVFAIAETMAMNQGRDLLLITHSSLPPCN